MSLGIQELWLWCAVSQKKIPESSDSMYSSIFLLESILYHYFTWSAPNSPEVVNFGFAWFGSLETPLRHENWKIQGIWAFIYPVRLVSKKLVLKSSGTQCEPVFAVWCLFLKEHTNALNQDVRLQYFPCWIVC